MFWNASIHFNKVRTNTVASESSTWIETLHKGQKTKSVIVPHFFLLLRFLCLQMPEHCANIIYREMCQNGNHLIQNQAETLTL